MYISQNLVSGGGGGGGGNNYYFCPSKYLLAVWRSEIFPEKGMALSNRLYYRGMGVMGQLIIISTVHVVNRIQHMI